MKYNTIEEFIKDWKSETQATLKILANLTDESLNKKVYDDGRTLGFIAWHIAITIYDSFSKIGLFLPASEISEDYPVFAEIIYNSYDKLAKSVIMTINLNWNDNSLLEEVDFFGETLSKSQVLDIMIKHQIHHRGQITVLMRQAGLKVPGIYGPSKEEWINLGMNPKR
jgi:uncharacterized damage-inducible protein DinB